MKQTLLKLCEAFGVSGNEEEAGKVIIDEINDFVDEIYKDPLGNIIAVKKSKIYRADVKKQKIMLFSHMDEQGLLATYIDDKGFVKFSPIGNFSETSVLGARVRFQNGVYGMIGCESSNNSSGNMKMSRLFIDIGAGCREQAMQVIRVGDAACFDNAMFEMGDNIFAKALDNRAGCAVLVEAARNIKENKADVYFVFTSQEKIGQRGAKTAAYYVNPDIAIMIDAASSNDVGSSQSNAIRCGKGPVVRIKDKSCIYHRDVRKMIEEAANELNITVQYETNENEAADAGIVCRQTGGVPSGALLLPVRYCNQPIGMVNIKDLQDAVKIIIKLVS